MRTSGSAATASWAALASVLMPVAAAVVVLPPILMVPSVRVARVSVVSLPLSLTGTPGLKPA
ncbi:hypothetical protein ACQEPV_022170 [Xanthomonas oryzae pv. oryzicola]|uniref:hypothetical protein n=1 Tax=Xanthomonas oryzae TaxID=347 RepID=UPI003D162BCB